MNNQGFRITNKGRAALIAMKENAKQDEETPAHYRIADALAEAGLLAPDLPAPYISLSTGEREWTVVDGYVNLHNGDLTVFYDERDEETYATEPAPERGEIRITDTTQGRELAYKILAACDLKDTHDD